MTMANSATSEFEEIIKEKLRDRFEDEFDFGPIVVMPRIGHDGEGYLHSYIVFDGNQEKLDPAWTLRLSRSLWPCVEELGYPGIPIQLFVKRSEWPTSEKKVASFGSLRS